jgi:hypothetical protein
VQKFKKKRAEKVKSAPPPQEPERRRRYSLVDDVLDTIEDKYANAQSCPIHHQLMNIFFFFPVLAVVVLISLFQHVFF